ncbi:NAD(P)H-dependent oxidoreductase [Cytobacillus sp. Hm23]
MNTLIIYTHPNHSSLCYSFLQKTLKGMRENANIKEIKVLDLYEEGFNPALVFNQDKRRRDMHKDPDLKKYRDQIIWAHKIVFIYPIWWGRPPAMLLGYIDQIFSTNFAYKNVGKIMPEGLLKGKSVVCISTMKGPEILYPLLILRNSHKRSMEKLVFNFVGIKDVKFFEFGNMENRKGKHTKKLEKVYQYFQQISS